MMMTEACGQLPSSFTPSPNTIVCGRGKICTEARGNRKLLQFVLPRFLPQYSQAHNKMEKSAIVSQIVNMVKSAAYPNVAFVKYEKGVWYNVTDSAAREKVGGMIRDCLHEQYRSSSQAKLARRRAIKGEHLRAHSPAGTPDGDSYWENMFDVHALPSGASMRGWNASSLNLPVLKDTPSASYLPSQQSYAVDGSPPTLPRNNESSSLGTSLRMLTQFLDGKQQPNPPSPPMLDSQVHALSEDRHYHDRPAANMMIPNNNKTDSDGLPSSMPLWNVVSAGQGTIDDLPDDLSEIFED